MNKTERIMNSIRYILCEDSIEYMDLLDKYVELAMEVE